MATYQILLTPGDGIGPEVMAEATKVLARIERRFKHEFQYDEEVIGGAGLDKYGVALRPETVAKAKASRAVLFGAVGGPKWDDPKALNRPEDAILGMRKQLGLFANLRPVRIHPVMVEQSSLKADVLEGTDMVVIRELTGGLYFGQPKKRWENASGRQAVDTLRYSEKEVERVLHVGFQLARQRRKKLTSVDKANVLRTGQMWREIAVEVGKLYPDVELNHLLVDAGRDGPAAAADELRRDRDGEHVRRHPHGRGGDAGRFDGPDAVGESWEAAQGRTGIGLYEPIHGSAPESQGSRRRIRWR